MNHGAIDLLREVDVQCPMTEPVHTSLVFDRQAIDPKAVIRLSRQARLVAVTIHLIAAEVQAFQMASVSTPCKPPRTLQEESE